MEVILTTAHVVLQPLQRGENSLWVCRRSGRLSLRSSWELAAEDNPTCLGLCFGLVGVMRPHPELQPRLALVRACERVTELPSAPNVSTGSMHSVYKVTQVALVAVTQEDLNRTSVGLKACPKHHVNINDSTASTPTCPTAPSECVAAISDGLVPPASTASSSVSPASGSTFSKLGGSLKTLASDTIKSTAGNAAAFASQVKALGSSNSRTNLSIAPTSNVGKILERFERRVLEEFLKLFNDSDSFYFSFSGDLTNSIQRQADGMAATAADNNNQENALPLWKRVDDRFFFNKHLVQDLIDLEDERADAFILPFVQGYVEVIRAPLAFEQPSSGLDGGQGPIVAVQPGDALPDYYTVALISRRSRFRAGTRYKRRGVDDCGNVANYVETEQLLMYHHYALSLVQTRGSVPVYWSQPGYKYRPPPRLTAPNEAEDAAAFAAHFDRELGTYGAPVCAVNLVERAGSEKVLWDAFVARATSFDCPSLSLICFDFHEYCRGMHMENVSVVVDALTEGFLRRMRFCWMDRHGLVCRQTGVVRVNCVDCLDRTNVVQTAIARAVLEEQLTKLGVFPPDVALPLQTRMAFQGLWANNGDVISRQYAGTNAMKGDFTRTGERNISGLMKDGFTSANRYYLNQFRDDYRQAAIDILTSQPVNESLFSGNLEERCEDDAEDPAAAAAQVQTIIEDCKKLLVPDLDSVIGAWPLIDNDPITGDPREDDMDIIFILTKDAYYWARYDDTLDKVTQYQRVLLSNVEKVEFGLVQQTFSMPFGKNQAKNEHSMRISYKMPSEDPGACESGFLHTFRASSLRFFNVSAVVCAEEEERAESLKCVADALAVALAAVGNAVEVCIGRMEKKRSKEPDVRAPITAGDSSIRNVGSRALNSVASQFSKLNPISKIRSSIRSSASKDVAAPLTPSGLDESLPKISGRVTPELRVPTIPGIEARVSSSPDFSREACNGSLEVVTAADLEAAGTLRSSKSSEDVKKLAQADPSPGPDSVNAVSKTKIIIL